MEVDDALVNAHLEAIVRVGTLTVGGLTRGDLQLLGGQTDGAGHLEVLVLGVLLDVFDQFLLLVFHGPPFPGEVSLGPSDRSEYSQDEIKYRV